MQFAPSSTHNRIKAFNRRSPNRMSAVRHNVSPPVVAAAVNGSGAAAAAAVTTATAGGLRLFFDSADVTEWRRLVAAAVNGNGAAAAAAVTTATAGGLRLFLDSADVTEWRRLARTGILYGVTTNPTILERGGVPCTLAAAAVLAREAAALGFKELQLQAVGLSADEMLAHARALRALRGAHCPGVQVTVKLPCTAAGAEVAARLREEDPSAAVTLTGVYAAHQVLAARALEADYAAPYLGRMGDASTPEAALAEVAQMAAACAATTAPGARRTRVLVASIRAAADVARLAAAGCDTFTAAAAVFDEMLGLPATLKAVADFDAAAARNQ